MTNHTVCHVLQSYLFPSGLPGELVDTLIELKNILGSVSNNEPRDHFISRNEMHVGPNKLTNSDIIVISFH